MSLAINVRGKSICRFLIVIFPLIFSTGSSEQDIYLMETRKELNQKEDIHFWSDYGLAELERSLGRATRPPNVGVAKNVLLFVGDGMSSTTITASRIYKEQKINGNFVDPEREFLTFERLDNMGHIKTFNTDYQVPDSASSGSALFSGIKTDHRTFGFDSSISKFDVETMRTAQKVSTILSWAQDAGKRTGIVTSARLTHATPAALYAHTYDRDWECDVAHDKVQGLHDIAWQLVNTAPGNRTNVLLGGGAPAFFPKEWREELRQKLPVPEEPWDCYRGDGLALADQWLRSHDRSAFAMDLDELKAVDVDDTDFLLGLFAEYHMPFYHEAEEGRDPTIVDLTEKAIRMLTKPASATTDNNGFFLMVESGRIDHAHHDNTATKALSETMALDLAVEKALALLEEKGLLDETLLVVTADHSHTMAMSGYAQRGSDIRGLQGYLLDDDLPATILTYATGPGYYRHNLVSPDDPANVTRLNLSSLANDQVTSFDFVQTSTGPLDSANHGGDDVAIFAQGPWAHLFHTTHDQTHVANVMAYAACLGRYQGRCRGGGGEREESHGPGVGGPGQTSAAPALAPAQTLSRGSAAHLLSIMAVWATLLSSVNI